MLEPNYTYKGKVLKVVDGDTLDIEVDLGFKAYVHMRFRLARINTPELNSTDPVERQKAVDVKNYVTATATTPPDCVIQTRKTDIYGRYIAEVFCFDGAGNQFNLSDRLLANGMAQPYTGK